MLWPSLVFSLMYWDRVMGVDSAIECGVDDSTCVLIESRAILRRAQDEREGALRGPSTGSLRQAQGERRANDRLPSTSSGRTGIDERQFPSTGSGSTAPFDTDERQAPFDRLRANERVPSTGSLRQAPFDEGSGRTDDDLLPSFDRLPSTGERGTTGSLRQGANGRLVYLLPLSP